MVTMSLAAPAPAPLFDPVLAVAVPVAGAVALPAVIMITMIIMILQEPGQVPEGPRE